MFENKVKKLPIVEGDRLVGLITLTDIVRATHTDEKTMNLPKRYLTCIWLTNLAGKLILSIEKRIAPCARA